MATTYRRQPVTDSQQRTAHQHEQGETIMNRITAIVTALIVLAVFSGLQAQTTTTWDGGHADGDWSQGGTGGNWSGAAAPVSDPDTNLVFAQNLNANISQNDNAGNFLLQSMTFSSGLPAFTVDGNRLELTNGPALTVNSDNAVTINNDMLIHRDMAFNGAGAGPLTLSGDVRLVQVANDHIVSTLTFTGDRNVEFSGGFTGVTEIGGQTNQASVIQNNLDAGRILTFSGNISLKDNNATGNTRHMTLGGSGDTIITADIRSRPDGAANSSHLTISNTGTTRLTGDNSGLHAARLSGAGAIEVSGTLPLGKTAELLLNGTKTIELIGNTTLQNASASGGTTFHVFGNHDLTVNGNTHGVNLGGSNPTNVAFRFDNPLTVFNGNFGIPITNGNRTLNVTGSGRMEINGLIPSTSNTGHTLFFNISGGGAVAFNNSDNFSSTLANPVTLRVQSGTLEIGADALDSGGALGSNTSVFVGHTSGSADAALVTAGPYEVGRAITVASGSSGSATLGGITADVSSFTNTITLNKSAQLTAAADGTVQFEGILQGSGGITKVGDGTVVLSGDNSFSGGTTVSSGTLLVGSNNGLGSGSLTVGDGTTIGVTDGAAVTNPTTFDGTFTLVGDGSFNPSNLAELTVGSGSTVAPGLSIGELTVGDITFDSGSVLNIEIGGEDPGEFDRLISEGTLTPGGTLNVAFINDYSPSMLGATFDILEWDVLGAGEFTLGDLPALSGYLFWDDSNLLLDGTLSIAVPEPTTALLLLGGVALTLLRRRRRN